MSKLVVIYWTGTGNTGAMAQAVADGAKSAGAEAELLTVSEISADAAAAYDKLALADVFRTRGSVLAEEYRENGVYYKATVKVDDLHRFEAYLL